MIRTSFSRIFSTRRLFLWFVYTIRPIHLRKANAFVKAHHRHNGGVQGAKFAISLLDEQGELIGVGIAGRPVGRILDDGLTLEITRVCVLPDHKNASSMIYGRLIKIGKGFGYKRIITYTLATESGASLRAVGAIPSAVVTGGGWNRKGRTRQEQPIYEEKKIRWVLWQAKT